MNLQAITDADGYINLGDIPRGNYSVEIEYGGRVFGETISVGSNEIITVSIEEIGEPQTLNNDNTLLITGVIVAVIAAVGFGVFLMRRRQ